MAYLGEILGVVTALGWATSSIMYERASKKVSGLPANLFKIFFLLVILSLITIQTRGMAFPIDATPTMKFYLGMSGIIGLFVGDFFLFKAYSSIGARVTLLLSTLGPIVVTILGFLFLGETLKWIQVLAILFTCLGIIIVVCHPKKSEKNVEFSVAGIVYGLIAIFTDAVGIILTKIGSTGYNSFSASQVRAIPALICFIIYITYRKDWNKVKIAIKDKQSMIYIIMGTLFSTIGICALVEGMKFGKIGVVSTLASTSPILIIPISVFIMKEKIKKVEIVGAIISCIGVSLLFV